MTVAVDILQAKRNEGELITGYARVTNFTKKPKRGNGFYGDGTITIYGGESITIRIWDESTIDIMLLDSQDGFGFYIHFEGKGNIYNGFNLQIDKYVLVDVKNLSDPQGFFSTKNNKDELSKALGGLLGRRISDKAQIVVGSIIKGNIANRFFLEFAGMKMHDASLSGLLNHTTKMLEITELVMKQHNNFHQSDDYVDLIYVGILLHDIGKIRELNDGVYTTKGSIAGHRFLGTEILFEFKDKIIEVYSEDWYYHLVAILTQHHGQYEERPRTIFAYIAHLIDSFDTSMTIIDEKVESSDSNTVLRMSDFNLIVEKESK